MRQGLSSTAYEELLTLSVDVVTVLDSSGVIRYQSPSVTRMLGYEPEAVLGDSVFEYVHPEDRAASREAFGRVVDGDDPSEPFEQRLECADGSWTWVESRAVDRRSSEIGGYVVSSREITGRKLRERELDQLRDLLDGTERIADVGGWEIDPDTKELFWTDHLFDLLGVDGETAPPLEAALDLLEDPDRPTLETALGKAVEDGEAFDVEVRVRRGDGERRWFRIKGVPTTEDGEVVALRGAVQDVTERKRREEELRRRQGLIDALSTTFPDYTFVYDSDGKYLDVVTGWMTGPSLYDAEELVGLTVDDVLSGEVADRLRSAIRTTLRTESLQTVEYTVETPGGTYWYEGNMVPLPRGYDGVPAVVLTARDVTERTEREERLRRQNERLDAFASVVSHDLRNPLEVAIAGAELARTDCDSEHLDTVDRGHERMGELIDDLLTLAREGEELGDLRAVDLAEAVERCWGTVATAGATLVTDTGATVRADPSRLNQLLGNLLRNAVDHGSERVTVRIGDLDDGFYVADDGPGIPPDERDRVFRTGHSTGDGGSGVGLHIVRTVAEAHGWEVRVTGSDAGGARFEFTGVELL